MRLEISIFGDKQVARELLRMQRRSQDMRPAFSGLHRSFLAIERRQFSTQGGFSGGWAPLAPSTVASKARRGLDPRILHATLALRMSLTSPNSRLHRVTIKPDELFMGTRAKARGRYPYPAAHQRGTRDGHVPQRRPVELTETHRRRWMRHLQRYLVEGVVET